MPAFDAAFYDTNMAAIFGAIKFARLTGGSACCIGPDATRGGMMASQIHGSDEAAQGVAHWGLYNEFMFRLIDSFGYEPENALNGPDSVKWFTPTDAQAVIDMLLANTGSGNVTIYHRKKILPMTIQKDDDGNLVTIGFVDRDTDAEMEITSPLWADCSPLADLAAESGGLVSSTREGRSVFDEYVGGNVDNFNGQVIGDSQVRDARGSIRWQYQYPSEIPDFETDKNTEPYNIRPCHTTLPSRISFASAGCKPPNYHRGDFLDWIAYVNAKGYTTAAQLGLNRGSITKTTCTISIASPAVVTKTAHGLVANKPVRLFTTGALPTGLVADKVYYVIATGLTADAFQVSETVGGAAIDTSGTQSGTQSYSDQPYSNQIGPIPNEKYASNFGDITGPLSNRFPTETFEQRERLKTELVYQWLGKLYTAAQDAAITSSALKADLALYGLCSDEHDGTLNKPYFLVPGMPELHYTRGDRRIIGRRVRQWKDVWGVDLAQNEPEPDAPTAEVTISIASPGVITDPGHGFAANQKIKITGGTLPTGITSGTVYYVKTVTSVDTYTISATSGGTAINTSGTQSGVHIREQVISPTRQWPYTAPVPDALWWTGYALDIHHGRNAAMADGSGFLSCLDFPHGFEGASYMGVGLDEIRFGKGICDNLVAGVAHSVTRPGWGVARLDTSYCSAGEGMGILFAYCHLNVISPADVTYSMVGPFFLEQGAPHSYLDIENFDPDFPDYPPP